MSYDPRKSAIFMAIGTELTSGEVVNTNGAWLSEKLEDCGINVVAHVVIPDERELIYRALENINAFPAKLLVLTGGLGPTTDDITREMLAQWAGVNLEFDEDVWRETQEKYKNRGLQIREAHRHQCFFPSGSRRLKNPVGTALGFSMQARGFQILVLPGPPMEIEGMWESEIADLIKPFQNQNPVKLEIWTLLGVTESEAAEVTEEVFKGSGILLGYRATVPYVKVKVWIPSAHPGASALIFKLDQKLKQWTVARGKEDIIQFWLEKIRPFKKVWILDPLTRGRMVQRLGQVDWPNHLQVISGGISETPLMSKGDLTLWLSSESEGQVFKVGWRTHDTQASIELSLPYKITKSNRRAPLYMTEMALKWWLENIPRH